MPTITVPSAEEDAKIHSDKELAVLPVASTRTLSALSAEMKTYQSQKRKGIASAIKVVDSQELISRLNRSLGAQDMWLFRADNLFGCAYTPEMVLELGQYFVINWRTKEIVDCHVSVLGMALESGILKPDEIPNPRQWTIKPNVLGNSGPDPFFLKLHRDNFGKKDV